MSKNITVNGTTYDASYVSAPLADGSGNATFRESSELSLQSKSVTPTESQQTVTPASDYFALDKVTVGAIPSEYVKPTVTNPGGELTAGSTIATGTYFSGAATVPSGGLEDGQTAVHDIPDGKILSAQVSLASTMASNAITATITLPDSLSGVLPDYIIAVMNNHTKINNNSYVFAFAAKTAGEYELSYGGLKWNHTANAWSAVNTKTAAPTASVEGTTLTIQAGRNTVRIAAGILTFYAIWVSDDAS